MSNKKNQHFVPQVYLRQFSDDGRSINLYIKTNHTFHSLAPIKNQSSCNFFYGKDLEIEDFMSSMEEDFGRILRKLSNGSSANLTQEDCEFLFGYTFLQWGRTESSALDLVFGSIEMNDFVTSTFKDMDTSKYRVTEDILNNVKTSIRLGYEMLQICSDLDYKFLINDTPIDFITSDCPVSLYNQFHERVGKRSFAFGSIGTQVFFPLSPHIMLIIYDNLCYKIGKRKTKDVHISDRLDIIHLNNITYVNAGKVIYFLNRDRLSSFESVKNIGRTTSKYTKFQYSNLGYFHSSNQPPLCNAHFSIIRECDRTKHIKSYDPFMGPLLRKSVSRIQK